MNIRRVAVMALLGTGCGYSGQPTDGGATATVEQSPAASRSESVAQSNRSFIALQSRGKKVMGVDQYVSQHVFEDLPTGGRIVLDRADNLDSADIRTIRQHMRGIATDFRVGDFSKPFAVHAKEVPGTKVMRAKQARVKYDVFDRPRGAELRITTKDSVARRAVHEFLAFQRADHRAPGTEGHNHTAGMRMP